MTGLPVADEEKRPVALVAFGVLAILGFVMTMLLGANEGHRGSMPPRPDPAIAAGIENDLSTLPGVKGIEVSNAIECFDDCEQTRHHYLATIKLTADVTPQEISAIVAAHDQIAPSRVGLNTVAMRMTLSSGNTLDVAAVHYGFGLTQAEAFLAATAASSTVNVAYGPPNIGESPLLTIKTSLPGLVCELVDPALSQVVPAVSAAAVAGGIPFATVSFDCGSVSLQAGIAAGTDFHPGWTEAATTIDRMCRDHGCGKADGTVNDIYIAFNDGTTMVTVELKDGQNLASYDLAKLHGVVDALSFAGAANPQLNLQNF